MILLGAAGTSAESGIPDTQWQRTAAGSSPHVGRHRVHPGNSFPLFSSYFLGASLQESLAAAKDQGALRPDEVAMVERGLVQMQTEYNRVMRLYMDFVDGSGSM